MPSVDSAPDSVLDTFNLFVAKSRRCWGWLGALTPDGYGVFSAGKAYCGSTLAHRFSYTQRFGPIGPELCIDHVCRTRLCVNPAHLRAVTIRENILAGLSPPAINARKQCCPKCKGPYIIGPKGDRRCLPCRRNYHRAYIARWRAKYKELQQRSDS